MFDSIGIAVNDSIHHNVTSIDIIYNGESMAKLLNNRILLVWVGYIRRGNVMKTVVQPDLFDGHVQPHMLISEQSSH